MRRLCAALAGAILAGLVAGCGPVKLVATADIPTPLISRLPFAVALYIPKEFSEYVHEEERWSTKWNVDLGAAQADGLTRLLTAMFERVERVDSINEGTQLGSDIRAILEPSIEEYAFVTPRDAGSTPFFAVSIRYRVNVYTPDGKLADSWGFTGYGTAPSQGLSSVAPLARATSLAMRDAGAKLAVEFREQAIVRGLMPAPEPEEGGEQAGGEASQASGRPSDTLGTASPPASTDEPSSQPSPGATPPEPAAAPTSGGNPAHSPAPQETEPPPPQEDAPGEHTPAAGEPSGQGQGAREQASPPQPSENHGSRNPETQSPEVQNPEPPEGGPEPATGREPPQAEVAPLAR